MIKMLKIAAIALCFSANSFAGVIVDTVTQNQFVGYWDSYSYTHDATTEGFVLGTATGGFLSIDIYDDNSRDCWGRCSDQAEVVLFTIEAFDFDTGAVSFGDFNGELEVQALAALNSDGLLDVTVTSLFGDFYVGNSTLTIETAEVPEPASIALLGLGLVGLAFARRKTA